MKLNRKSVARNGYVSWSLQRRGNLVLLHWTAEQYSNRKAVADQIRRARARLFRIR